MCYNEMKAQKAFFGAQRASPADCLPGAEAVSESAYAWFSDLGNPFGNFAQIGGESARACNPGDHQAARRRNGANTASGAKTGGTMNYMEAVHGPRKPKMKGTDQMFGSLSRPQGGMAGVGI